MKGCFQVFVQAWLVPECLYGFCPHRVSLPLSRHLHPGLFHANSAPLLKHSPLWVLTKRTWRLFRSLRDVHGEDLSAPGGAPTIRIRIPILFGKPDGPRLHLSTGGGPSAYRRTLARTKSVTGETSLPLRRRPPNTVPIWTGGHLTRAFR